MIQNPQDVQISQAATFRFRPADYWDTPTGKVLDISGATLETLSPSVDATSTTVVSASSSSVVTLASGTGFARGRVYRFDLTDGYAYAEVSKVDGDTIYLVDPLPSTPAASDAVRGVEISATITAIATAGVGYRVVVEQSGKGHLVAYFSVVKHPFENPVDTRKVRRWVSKWFGNAPLISDDEACEDVAEKCGRRIRSILARDLRYPHRVFDPAAFEEAGDLAMRLILAADHYLVPGAVEPHEYRRQLEMDLERVVGAIAKAAPYDEDNDDAVDESEAEGVAWALLER